MRGQARAAYRRGNLAVGDAFPPDCGPPGNSRADRFAVIGRQSEKPTSAHHDVDAADFVADTDTVTNSVTADLAANALLRRHPRFSAASPFPRWQKTMLAAIAVALPVAAISGAELGFAGLSLALSLPFALVVLIRLAALAYIAAPYRQPPPAACPDADLPVYSVLVPLFRERDIAPALIEAMRAIDYPPERIEILLITEASDAATREALYAAKPAPNMRILTVPAGTPQTKPRALNFALEKSRGDLIAIFDAEDIPDPGQLRAAAAMFASANDRLACVQARLSIDNPEETFLSGQFALEYAVLFRTILPALERMGLPILLGGTSNHFRRSALEAVGGWDAYNVTEDADLGVRIARFGYRVANLDSDTWEEAPTTARIWLGQRTRWLKGWMQTYLVHTRAPRMLLADLGGWQTLGLLVILGGMILSALVHPLIYLAAATALALGQPVVSAASGLWLICWFNFAVGHAAGIALALITAWKSGGRLPVQAALLVPVYWLAISAAAYRALWDFYRRPYYWEKTPHAARQSPQPAFKHRNGT